MACPISWRTIVSKLPEASSTSTSSVSNLIKPNTLVMGHESHTDKYDALPRTPLGPSMNSSWAKIRSRPGGKSSFPIEQRWLVMTSSHLLVYTKYIYIYQVYIPGTVYFY